MKNKHREETLFLTLLVTLAVMFLLTGCQTKQPPLYGPWGESHQEQLRRTYSEAWCDGFLAGYEAKKREGQRQSP